MQVFHANLLKPYFGRDEPLSHSSALATAAVPLPVPLGPGGGERGSDGLDQGLDYTGVDVKGPDDTVWLGRLRNSESLAVLPSLLSHLTPVQVTELVTLIDEFPSLFSDTPSRTTLITHDIDVGGGSPCRKRFYRVSGARQKVLDAEVRYLIENGLAEQTSSSWASPCLLVSN